MPDDVGRALADGPGQGRVDRLWQARGVGRGDLARDASRVQQLPGRGQLAGQVGLAETRDRFAHVGQRLAGHRLQLGDFSGRPVWIGGEHPPGQLGLERDQRQRMAKQVVQVPGNSQSFLGGRRPGQLRAGSAQHVERDGSPGGAVGKQGGQRRDDDDREGIAGWIMPDDDHDDSGDHARRGPGQRRPWRAAEPAAERSRDRERAEPVDPADDEQGDRQAKKEAQFDDRDALIGQTGRGYPPDYQTGQHDNARQLEPLLAVHRAAQQVEGRLQQDERNRRADDDPANRGDLVVVRLQASSARRVAVHVLQARQQAAWPSCAAGTAVAMTSVTATAQVLPASGAAVTSVTAMAQVLPASAAVPLLRRSGSARSCPGQARPPGRIRARCPGRAGCRTRLTRR